MLVPETLYCLGISYYTVLLMKHISTPKFFIEAIADSPIIQFFAMERYLNAFGITFRVTS